MSNIDQRIVGELPTLSHLMATRSPLCCDQTTLVLITHLLPTAIGYIQLLGAMFDLDIVAIPYSVQPEVVNKLRSLGYRISTPSDVRGVQATAMEKVEHCTREGRRVLVQEIGGYLAEEVERLGALPRFLGVVEDTNNGHWRYDAVEATRVQFPVVSIAHSPVKAIEDKQVGDAVTFSIERIVRAHQYRVVRGVVVLVFGFGSIGGSCARALRDRGARVLVSDTDPIKRLAASVEGFIVGSPEELVPCADIIVGATGRCSINRSVIEAAKDSTLLVSASSRWVEIDVEYLSQCEKRSHGQDLSLYVVHARSVYVATECSPVNFSDNSVLGSVLDAIYAELYLCILEILEGRAFYGLQDSPPRIHKLVAETWCQKHAREIWSGVAKRPTTDHHLTELDVCHEMIG